MGHEPVGERETLTSWLGLSPSNRVTGGRIISSRTTPSANRAATALRLAAFGLHRSDSALVAFLRRKKAQLGPAKAITATAHRLARIIYSMLKSGNEYTDPGAEHCETQYRDRALRNTRRRASKLGYQLVPINGYDPGVIGTPGRHAGAFSGELVGSTPGAVQKPVRDQSRVADWSVIAQ